MKKLLTLLLLVSAALSSCRKCDDMEDGTPKCITKKIKTFHKSSACNDAKVNEYMFQSKTVYTFEEGTCGADMTTAVLDADCNELGQLGGIAGNTRINGDDFSQAVFVKTVWEK